MLLRDMNQQPEAVTHQTKAFGSLTMSLGPAHTAADGYATYAEVTDEVNSKTAWAKVILGETLTKTGRGSEGASLVKDGCADVTAILGSMSSASRRCERKLRALQAPISAS